MPDDGGQFVGGVADALIVRKRDAVVLAAVFQPLLIWTVRGKQVVMPFNRQTGSSKDVGKTFT